MKNKMIIAIYMRLSQDDGDFEAESNSIANQRDLLLSYAAKHFENYDLLEFKDDGYTGANFNRPGVSKLLDKVRNGKIDCIIVKDLSRFSRDYIEMGAYLEQIFPFSGVRFIAVNDGYDSDRYKGDVAGLDTSFITLMNDFYCKDISVKVKSALKVKKEKGIYANGSCTFGYRKDEADRHKLLIVEEEAAVVKRIFEMTLEGASSNQIAKQFNAEGIKTPIEYKMERGIASMRPKAGHFEWSASTICQILRNATYVGDFVYDKYETPEVSGKAKLKPRNEWKIFKNHHEAIIDRKTFAQIQSGRGIKKAVRYKRHPLIGKIECGCCHKSLRIERTKNPYFLCPNRYVTRNEGCVYRVNVQFLEQYLLFELQEEAEKQADIQSACKDAKNRIEQELKDVSSRRKQICRKRKELQEAQSGLYEAYVFKRKSREQYRKEKQEVQDEIERCMEKENLLGVRIKALEEKSAEMRSNVYEYLQKHSVAEISQEMAELFIKRIVVYDECNIEVEWNFLENLPEKLLPYQLAIT